MADPAATASLSTLRARIDAIDEQLHQLLIERGSVVDALVEAKGTSTSGVAFRPQREAEMMRRLVQRHTGHLPLATVEHLWREIITTFTYLQAPFRLVVDYGSEPVMIHDLARFAFGFSVELVKAANADDVVAKVAETGSDLGLIPLGDGIAATPWWRGLSMADGPRAMALWPFITDDGWTDGHPALVISPPLTEPADPDIKLIAARTSNAFRPETIDAVILSTSEIGEQTDLLLAVPGGSNTQLQNAEGLSDVAIVGGIARGIAMSGGEGLLRDSADDL